MVASAAEQQAADVQAVREELIANDNLGGEEDSQIVAALDIPSEEACEVLRQADSNDANSEWGDHDMPSGSVSGSHLAEQSTQAEENGETSQVVGVSYADVSNINMSESQSSQVAAPFVLTSGSGTLAVTSPNDEKMPSSNFNNTSEKKALQTATAELLKDADNQANDVQMEDSEVQSDATPIEASSATLAATHIDEVQYVSSNMSNQAGGPVADTVTANSDAAALLSSFDSAVPLAQLRSAATPRRSASVARSLVSVRRAHSRLAAASQASGLALIRRAGSHRASASPAPPMLSRQSPFELQLEEERHREIIKYLTGMVANDKLRDDQEYFRLNESRSKVDTAYEQAARKYEEEMNVNELQMQLTRNKLQLKNDTIRMLRNQYRQEIAQEMFRSRTVEGSRIGSARRSRSRSTERSRHTSIAAGRMSAPASVLATVGSAQLVKGERIDLTRDGEDDEAGRSTAAGNARRYLGRFDGRSQAATAKMGDVNDLLDNPTVPPKRSKSFPFGLDEDGAAISRAGSPSFPEIGNRAVREWMSVVSRSRASSRPATPAASFAGVNAGSNNTMPPPRVPLVEQGQSITAIVIGNDDETDTLSTAERKRQVRQGKQRHRSFSRAPSVASAISRTSQRGQRNEPHSTPYSRSRNGSVAVASAPAKLTQADVDSDDEDEEPLFMGQQASSVATSRFSELIGE